MKKVLSLVLVLTLVLGTFSFTFAASDDITGHENEAAIRRLVKLGLVEGDSQGYKPDETITRAQFAALVVRATGNAKVAELAKGATAFTDVPATHWATGYINVASNLNFINGYGNGNFGPEDVITYEQAITLIVRALGYEPEATEKGGYPIGYLVVANDLDLTNDVDGVAGVPASRGTVFQMLDNALTVPMMVAEKVGGDATYVVDEDKTMLDEIGFEKITGRMVERVNDDNEIVLDVDGEDTVVVVGDDFDSEAIIGLEITAWVDGDDLVIYELEDEPKFDATSGAEDEITLVAEDKDYEVAKDAVLVLNGEKVKDEDFTADYAKVVLNDDDEIVWAEGYTFDDFMVVEKEDDEVVYSFDDEELDVDDYTIVKDGASIVSTDLEEGDILFFNEDEAYAVVYNNSETGKLNKVYDDSFKFEGDVYSSENVRYLDGDTLDTVDADVLDAMKDEGSVEVFFNFAGDAVLVVGDTGEEETDYYYGLVTANTVGFSETTRNETELYFTFDILTEDGEVVEHDLSASFAAEYGDEDAEVESDTALDDPMFDTWKSDIKADEVVKVTVDEDGDIIEVEVLDSASVTDVEIDDTYARGYKLQDDAVVFLANADKYKDYGVFAWSDAEDEFTEIEDGTVFVGSNGRVVAILATETDAEDAIASYTGLVTNVRKLSSDDYEITIEVAGKESEYVYTPSDNEDVDAYEETIVTIDVNEDDEIVAIYEANEKDDEGNFVGPKAETRNLVVLKVTTSKNGTIKVGDSVYNSTYELVDDAVIYDGTDDFARLSIRDIEEGDEINVYFVNADATRFVNYVVRTAVADSEDEDDDVVSGDTFTFKGSYSLDSNTYVQLDDATYPYVGEDDLDGFANGNKVKATFATIRGEKVVTKLELAE